MKKSLQSFGQSESVFKLCLLLTLSLLLSSLQVAETHAKASEKTSEKTRWFGSFRSSFGAAWYFSPADQLGFQYDLTVGALALKGLTIGGVARPLVELGYSRHGGSAINGRGNYFVTGAGVSLRSGGLVTTIIPSFIVGDSEGDTVYGVRSALRSDLLLGVLSLELAHEWRSVRQEGIHSIRGMLGIDVLKGAYLFLGLFLFSAMR